MRGGGDNLASTGRDSEGPIFLTQPLAAEDPLGNRLGSTKQAELELRIALDRRCAKDDRARAAEDRTQATHERAEAARERNLAARDRAQAAIEREASAVDDLTRVRRRGPGMDQLQRELDRARRTEEQLVVAFIDVDGLKRVNDTLGHLAGDAVLRAVADSLRACLRSYDLVMRYGGDEFVCVLPNADVESIRERFVEVSSALARGPANASVTVGFAELDASDTSEGLVHRADTDLLARRERAAQRRQG